MCMHCCNEGDYKEMSVKEIIYSLKKISEFGKDIRFSGGEPLLDIEKLSIAAKEADKLGMKAAFTTNGFLIEEKIEDILKLPLDRVQVSLDGLENTHNKIRKNELSFQKTIEGIKSLKENKARVYVSTCITNLNYKELPEIYELCNELSVDRYRVFPMIPVGKADKEILVKPDELKQTLEGIADWSGKTEISYPKLYTYGKETYNCKAGKEFLNIRVNGDVTACMYLEKVIGNILKQDIPEILKNVSEAKLEISDCCSGCKELKYCRGGCQAFKENNMNDLYCWRD